MEAPDTNPLFNANKLKLGTFSSNLVNCQTRVPKGWHPTWGQALQAAIAADEEITFKSETSKKPDRRGRHFQTRLFKK